MKSMSAAGASTNESVRQHLNSLTRIPAKPAASRDVHDDFRTKVVPPHGPKELGDTFRGLEKTIKKVDLQNQEVAAGESGAWGLPEEDDDVDVPLAELEVQSRDLEQVEDQDEKSQRPGLSSSR